MDCCVRHWVRRSDRRFDCQLLVIAARVLELSLVDYIAVVVVVVYSFEMMLVMMVPYFYFDVVVVDAAVFAENVLFGHQLSLKSKFFGK